MLFKVGAVPFHSWIPDVYQGAPTPITAFMAAATKIAAFGALLRIFYVALPGLARRLAPGDVGDRDPHDGGGRRHRGHADRHQAHAGVLVGGAHAGFILTGVIALNDGGLSSTLFYLVAYGFSTLGAFAVVSLVRNADGEEDTDMSRWAGLGRRYPLVGVVFALFLLAFAGIPLTSGFVSKFAVFKAAGRGRRDPAGDRRRPRQRHRGILLRASHRADVLHRPAARRARGGDAELDQHSHGRH